MNEVKFPIDIKDDATAGIPACQATFGRINVLMGENGSGKTKLLKHIFGQHHFLFQNYDDAVFIDSGRDIRIPDERQEERTFKLSQYLNTRSNGTNISSRFPHAISAMADLEKESKLRHSDSVTNWQKNGSPGPAPECEVNPFDQLVTTFNAISNNLKLTYIYSVIFATNNTGSSFELNSLSDGQKQLFALIVDLIVLSQSTHIYFIDEPELHLHPTLAEDFWTQIESQFSQAVFVYSTHSISFALRSRTDCLFVIGIGQITRDILLHDANSIRPFLGSLPGIINSRKCLLIEGEDVSFDKTFYSWILSDLDVFIIPSGPSSNVISAVKREGVWAKISSDIRLFGVIDHDYGDNHKSVDPRCILLPYHEAESYFCHPELFSKIVGVCTGDPNQINSIIENLFDFAANQRDRTIIRRFFARSNSNLSFTFSDYKDLTLPDFIERLDSIISKRKLETSELFDAKIRSLLEEQKQICDDVIKQQNVDQFLQVFEGKECLRYLLEKYGLKVEDALRVAVSGIDPLEHPSLRDLRLTLQRLIA